MPEAKSKVIAGETFKISQPYTAGHTLTEPEASALNQVRSENIGNNLRKAVEDAKEKGDLSGLEALVADYDTRYTFAMGGGGGQRLDPVEREARGLATEHVKKLLAEKGLSPKTVPEGYTEETWKAKVAANIDKFASHEAMLKLAKQRVAQKSKIGTDLGALLES